MKFMKLSDMGRNFEEVLDSVIDDQEEVTITRSGKESVVMIPLDQWESIKETLYLMSTKANHLHLLKSIDEDRRGIREAHDLIEE